MTHGKFTLGDATIPAEIKECDSSFWEIMIDEASTLTTLYAYDGWTFTPDPEPLPTKRMAIVYGTVKYGSREFGPYYWYLTEDGAWSSEDGNYAYGCDGEVFQLIVEKVIFEGVDE